MITTFKTISRVEGPEEVAQFFESNLGTMFALLARADGRTILMYSNTWLNEFDLMDPSLSKHHPEVAQLLEWMAENGL